MWDEWKIPEISILSAELVELDKDMTVSNVWADILVIVEDSDTLVLIVMIDFESNIEGEETFSIIAL